MITLRAPTPEEGNDPTRFPEGLRNWGFPYLDLHWSFIVEFDGSPIALIITSFASGILVIWRVLSIPDAKRVCGIWLRLALLQIMDNAGQRGCLGYLSLLEDSHADEMHIARIVVRAGGVLRPFTGTLAVGVLQGAGCPTSESPKSSPSPVLH